MINNWLFSSNYKHINTLHLLFARLWKTNLPTLVLVALVLIYVFLSSDFTHCMPMPEPVIPEPKPEVIQVNSAAVLVTVSTISSATVLIAATAPTVAGKLAAVGVGTASAIAVMHGGNAVKGIKECGLSVNTHEGVINATARFGTGEDPGSPTSRPVAHSILEKYDEMQGWFVNTLFGPNDNPMHVLLDQCVLLLSFIGFFTILICINTIFSRYLQTTVNNFLQNKSGKVFVYLKKLINFSTTFNIYYVIYLAVSILTYVFILISWMLQLKDIVT